jgi:hydroxycarboxylate dehydrogenase B
MVVKPAGDLRELVKSIFLAAGADERNATAVAEHLVLSNVRGVYSHGVWHTARYVQSIREGLIVPTAWPELVRETPNSALVSGNWGFGHTAAKFAMETALAKAADQAMATVGLVEANHIGRLGTYAEMAAERGFIGQVWASGYGAEEPQAVPYGGAAPILHTNPIALGFPTGQEPPIIIDFATTATAGSKVYRARALGQQLPPGCVVDAAGNPTTDPNAFFQGGALLPFGGHKGYAFMLACELMGRVFAAADAHAATERGGPAFRHQGVTMIVLKADLFQPAAAFRAGVDGLTKQIHAVPPAPGFSEVLVPGDLEARAQADRERNGVPIDDDVWQSLVDVAAELGVTRR